MRKKLEFPMRFWGALLVLLLIFQFSTAAEASDCKFEKTISLQLDLANSESLAIDARAGDLDIEGVSNSNMAEIEGHVCVSKESWLEDSHINTSEGKQAKIKVDLPKESSGWSWTGNSYKYIDLTIKVPADLELDVRDSSGDITMEYVGAVNLQDSSGDIDIVHSAGPITIRDSSGDISVEHIGNDVTVESDSSGDIELEDINGNALVERDSSGEITFEDIQGNAIVERDSSGSISAKSIGGDFRVDKDGSGSIDSRNVKGTVTKPLQKQHD